MGGRKTGGRITYPDHVNDAGVIRSHLRRVLQSPVFRGARRSSAFLEFVVEGALANRWDELKERSIAVAVFDRAPGVDLTEDTIVRVGAREVRKRLAQYYVSAEAVREPVRIDLAAGTYVPQFLPAPSQPELHVETHAPRRRWPLVAAIGCVVAAAAAWLLLPGKTDEIGAFWKPIAGGGSTVLIGVPNPVVYQPSLDAWERNTASFQGHPSTLQAPFEFPEKDLAGSDMVRVRNQFVGYADLVAAGEVTSFLSSHGKTVRYRLATNIEFSDLRDSPVVLIGAFTNRWTTELTHQMRFRFNWGEEMRPQIEESATGRLWKLAPGLSDPNSPEDYVLITRIVNSPTGKPFLILAGLKQAGTEAAGYVTTRAAEIHKILTPLQLDWRAKNVQLVLHTRVVGGRPSDLELVAYHAW